MFKVCENKMNVNLLSPGFVGDFQLCMEDLKCFGNKLGRRHTCGP